MVTQDLLNQENGGIKDSDIDNFESGNPDFLDRSIAMTSHRLGKLPASLELDPSPPPKNF